MNKRIHDLTGQRFGKLVIIELDEEKTKHYHQAFWICKCDCGNIKSIQARGLVSGDIKTCNLCNPKDITSNKYGRLTPIKWFRKNKAIYWECKCDCGKTVNVLQSNLLSGKSHSCGCLQKELASKRFGKHYMRNTPLLDCYYNMKSRCYDKNNTHYKSYGGRGITVCDEWKNSSKTFVDWALSSGYKQGLTIDRIDVNGNYSPKNCRWITMKEQSYNRQNSIIITISGTKKCLKEWTTLMGWNYSTYNARHRRGKYPFNENELQQIINVLKETKYELL